ncbi:unnamed protein product [Cunninghamella blakesleeana]
MGQDADPEWAVAANRACSIICGGNGTVVPNWNNLEIEKCKDIGCNCSNSKDAKTDLPKDAPCIRYFITAPPFKQLKGKCKNGICIS